MYQTDQAVARRLDAVLDELPGVGVRNVDRVSVFIGASLPSERIMLNFTFLAVPYLTFFPSGGQQ